MPLCERENPLFRWRLQCDGSAKVVGHSGGDECAHHQREEQPKNKPLEWIVKNKEGNILSKLRIFRAKGCAMDEQLDHLPLPGSR